MAGQLTPAGLRAVDGRLVRRRDAANPGDTVNCDDFDTQAQAQAWFEKYEPYYGDIARLDRDDNGIACESLP